MNDEMGAVGRLLAVADGVPPRPQIVVTLDNDERASLRALVHYAVQKGDADGNVSDGEAWHMAETVVAELTNGRRHTTSSIPDGFYVRVFVNRLRGSVSR